MSLGVRSAGRAPDTSFNTCDASGMPVRAPPSMLALGGLGWTDSLGIFSPPGRGSSSSSRRLAERLKGLVVYSTRRLAAPVRYLPWGAHIIAPRQCDTLRTVPILFGGRTTARRAHAPAVCPLEKARFCIPTPMRDRTIVKRTTAAALLIIDCLRSDR